MQSDIMPVNQWVYNAKLAQMCGPDVPLQPKFLETTYGKVNKHILGSPDTFRDKWGPEELTAYQAADKFCEDILAKELSHTGPSNGVSAV